MRICARCGCKAIAAGRSFCIAWPMLGHTAATGCTAMRLTGCGADPQGQRKYGADQILKFLLSFSAAGYDLRQRGFGCTCIKARSAWSEQQIVAGVRDDGVVVSGMRILSRDQGAVMRLMVWRGRKMRAEGRPELNSRSL